MMTTWEKACNGMYLEKYNKDGAQIRTAEQFESGKWVVHELKTRTGIGGEYSNEEFQEIRRKFF